MILGRGGQAPGCVARSLSRLQAVAGQLSTGSWHQISATYGDLGGPRPNEKGPKDHPNMRMIAVGTEMDAIIGSWPTKYCRTYFRDKLLQGFIT